jgi:hypothetical protein
MDDSEIEKAVDSLYKEFVEYMKHVEGFFTVAEISQLQYWEKWKALKYKDQLHKEIHKAMQSVTK